MNTRTSVFGIKVSARYHRLSLFLLIVFLYFLRKISGIMKEQISILVGLANKETLFFHQFGIMFISTKR